MMDDIEAQLAQLESQDSSDDMETQPLSKTLKPKQTPVKNSKTPVKNNKTPVKNNKTPAKNNKTPAKNNKTPAKNNKTKLKKTVASSQITPPNEEIKMEVDSSDDESEFTGFVSCPFLVFFYRKAWSLKYWVSHSKSGNLAK